MNELEDYFFKPSGRSDKIEVKLIDTSYHVYYKQNAQVNSKRDMINLIRELKEKGVDILKFIT